MPSCRPLKCQPRRRAAPARASSSFFSAPTSSDTQIVPALLPRTIAIPNPHLRLSPLPPPDEGDGCCKEQVKEESLGPRKYRAINRPHPPNLQTPTSPCSAIQRVAEALSKKLSSALCCMCEGGSSLSLFSPLSAAQVKTKDYACNTVANQPTMEIRTWLWLKSQKSGWRFPGWPYQLRSLDVFGGIWSTELEARDGFLVERFMPHCWDLIVSTPLLLQTD